MARSLGMTQIPEFNVNKTAWTCIAVTCSNLAWAEAIQIELEILKKEGKIHQETILIVLEDPAPAVGSGGATLNALLVIAEKLSAKFNYPVISSEVLSNSRILILHQGRQYPYDPCSKAFVMCPCYANDQTPSCCSSLTTNLEHVLNQVNMLQISSPPGLWVCSTDMVLLMSNTERLNFNGNPDGIMVCVPANVSYAVNHGTVVMDQQGYVKNILYGAPKEDIYNHSDHEDNIPLVSGIVYLSSFVAEILLSFHDLSPLDCCTYMGLDSGAKFLRVSLVFDILLAMSTGLSKDDFMSGNCGKAYNKKLSYKFDADTEMLMEVGRTKVWEVLNKFKLKAEVIKTGQHIYLSETKNIASHIYAVNSVVRPGIYHSICKAKVGENAVVLNSNLSSACTLGADCIVQHSVIKGGISVGDRCYISSVNMDVEDKYLHLKDDICLLNFPVKIRDSDLSPTHFYVIFGTKDNIHNPISKSSGTFCNEKWHDFIARTGIREEDLWSNEVAKDDRTLYNAKLFSILQRTYILSWLQNGAYDQEILESWRNECRVSVEEILKKIDPVTALKNRRVVFGDLTCEIIKSILLKNEDEFLTPYFKLASFQGWSDNILKCLDEIAVQVLNDPQSNGNIKRVLFCIADLLGCMGGNEAGIRSGPAGNKTWDSAFTALDEGYYHEAVRLMSERRTQWINKPEQLLRAARHYEKAAHYVIQKDMASAVQLINLKETNKPPLDTWVLSECPIRVDVMGGWTDTPPQCYELMGSVVDISFLLKGKRPVGSKGRRIEPLKIQFVLRAESGLEKQVSVDNIEGILDYARPNTPAALLKAAVIVTGIIDIHRKESLEMQLKKNLGSGLELHTWADVPQGSGLGTSSILAGAICSTLWILAGKTFTRRDLIHAVLLVEQISTTGGGWQDVAAGITGGVCNGVSRKGTPVEVNVDRISLSDKDLKKLEQHLILIYTGKVRLARNILQNTIRNWYAREKSVLQSFKRMLSEIDETIKSLKSCDLKAIGQMLSLYWELKKSVAPGCEPTRIRAMMDLLEPHVHGLTLAGAGGGGFLCVLTKEPNFSSHIAQILEEAGYTGAKVYPSTIDKDGIQVEVDGTSLQILHA